jgi:hypothetical protein
VCCFRVLMLVLELSFDWDDTSLPVSQVVVVHCSCFLVCVSLCLFFSSSSSFVLSLVFLSHLCFFSKLFLYCSSSSLFVLICVSCFCRYTAPIVGTSCIASCILVCLLPSTHYLTYFPTRAFSLVFLGCESVFTKLVFSVSSTR